MIGNNIYHTTCILHFRHWNNSLEFDDGDQSEFESLLDSLMDPVTPSSYLSGSSPGGLSLTDRISTGMTGQHCSPSDTIWDGGPIGVGGPGFGGSRSVPGFGSFDASAQQNITSSTSSSVYSMHGSRHCVNGSGINGDGPIHDAWSNKLGDGLNVHAPILSASSVTGVHSSFPSSLGKGVPSDSGFGSAHTSVSNVSYHHGSTILDDLDGEFTEEMLTTKTTTGVQSPVTSNSYGSANMSQVRN